ncbi:MAG: TetR/AcrR family transcriptional regulator [Proteobacteria bacterium]|jgi:AcrR family transcriptional regulator|nr:TetR/AcrR family transcriptional regulator [Pseudomonadota bacterium]
MGKKRQVARSPEDLSKKRDMILDTAMTLLLDQGYTRTTMSDVAKAADIGRGTVYWHFPSKDGLFLALITRETDIIRAALEPMATSPGPALDAIDGLVQASFQYYQEAAPFLKGLLSILGGAGEEMEQQLVAMMSDVYREYNQLVTNLLERGKAEGTVCQELDSQVTAAAIIVILDAMFLQISFGLIPNDADRLTKAITTLIHHGCTHSGVNDA